MPMILGLIGTLTSWIKLAYPAMTPGSSLD